MCVCVSVRECAKCPFISVICFCSIQKKAVINYKMYAFLHVVDYYEKKCKYNYPL